MWRRHKREPDEALPIDHVGQVLRDELVAMPHIQQLLDSFYSQGIQQPVNGALGTPV